jgi:hypothetical protein
MQPTSDDASHDETLSSRVAALNMLDLGLEHLDIQVEEARPELDFVVKACGESMSGSALAIIVLKLSRDSADAVGCVSKSWG